VNPYCVGTGSSAGRTSFSLLVKFPITMHVLKEGPWSLLRAELTEGENRRLALPSGFFLHTPLLVFVLR
jgi:hypothetical protein